MPRNDRPALYSSAYANSVCGYTQERYEPRSALNNMCRQTNCGTGCGSLLGTGYEGFEIEQEQMENENLDYEGISIMSENMNNTPCAKRNPLLYFDYLAKNDGRTKHTLGKSGGFNGCNYKDLYANPVNYTPAVVGIGGPANTLSHGNNIQFRANDVDTLTNKGAYSADSVYSTRHYDYAHFIQPSLRKCCSGNC